MQPEIHHVNDSTKGRMEMEGCHPQKIVDVAHKGETS